ncbi:MAG: S1 RNA-binding domain-containing protein [Candidatus Helarchaeota archaeon]
MEIFQFAEVLLCRKDFTPNIAFLLFDVCIETIIKNFLIHYKDISGSELHKDVKEKFEKRISFPDLIDLIEKTEEFSEVEIDKLKAIRYYHTVRNKLYHNGDGVTVRYENANRYYDLTKYFLCKLFKINISEQENPFDYKLLYMDSKQITTREKKNSLETDLIIEGKSYEGKVVGIDFFGAFIDINGKHGFVHLSEISNNKIVHPREVLSIGQVVGVKVLSIDETEQHLSLSIRQSLDPARWRELSKWLSEGKLIEGEIIQLTNFGAYARIPVYHELYIEGFIPIHEIQEGNIDHPIEVFHVGELVALRITKIVEQELYMELSLDKVDDPIYTDLDWKTLTENNDNDANSNGHNAENEDE